jgi:predicted transcriptional regulator
MVTLTVSLDDELAEALQTLATQSQVTEEELIKRAVQNYVVTFQSDDPLVGLFDLGAPDLAEQAEEILHASIKPHTGWTGKE